MRITNIASFVPTIAQKIKDKAEIQSFFSKFGDFHGANPDISECC
jgi:hypothetical protein